MTTVAFFNNKGGVGKTSLVYHLAWMYAEMGVDVVAADLDPQANLTSMFLEEDVLEGLWPPTTPGDTVYGALRPQFAGRGDIESPKRLTPRPGLSLVAGDLALSSAEDRLSDNWYKCLSGDELAFRIMSAFARVLHRAQNDARADLVLIDVGPNLGAINRAALIAADCVVVPLAPDLFSLQGLRNLGPTLRDWRVEWQTRLKKASETNDLKDLDLPEGNMQPVGYVVQQHAVRLDRPVKAYARWMERIPGVYRESVLDDSQHPGISVEIDEHCLGLLKNYRSLMPYAQDARKPMFLLRTADGAIGSHFSAVRACYEDYQELAKTIASRVGIEYPQLD